MSFAKSKPTWSGPRTEEPWQPMVNSHTVKLAQEAFQAALAAGTYKIPSVKPITDAERSRDYYSDFEDADDEEEKASPSKDVEASAADASAEQEDTGETGDGDQGGEEDAGDDDDAEGSDEEEGDSEDEGGEAGVDGE
ncbi:hypothetical protein DVH05_019254 [Phytophthora capsici]|nr:hypothetical protein DVH05_019254 [Phytophthora capsici]